MSKIYIYWNKNAYKDSENPLFVCDEKGLIEIHEKTDVSVNEYKDSLIRVLNKLRSETITGLYDRIIYWVFNNPKNDSIYPISESAFYLGFISLRFCDSSLREIILNHLSGTSYMNQTVGFDSIVNKSNIADILLLIRYDKVVEPMFIRDAYPTIGRIGSMMEIFHLSDQWDSTTMEYIDAYIESIGRSKHYSGVQVLDHSLAECSIDCLIDKVKTEINLDMFYSVDILNIPESGILKIQNVLKDEFDIPFMK